jgi:2-polyprenyl-3-methyl-5-hydroxy-6-metoxy-1,4-benzoquinol methylase
MDSNSNNKLLTPEDVSKILVDAYPSAGLLARLLIRWRPFICPFHEIIPYIPLYASVLEVGCGVGLMTVLLANLGKIQRGAGIDISRKPIDIARGAVYPKTCDVSFECLPENASWPEGFDTVLCIDVLHHIPRDGQRQFIQRLISINPGRTIIFKDVSPRPFWMAAASVLHDLLLSGQWISIPDEHEVRTWFEAEGLLVVEQRRLDTLWYSHYLVVAEKDRKVSSLNEHV